MASQFNISLTSFTLKCPTSDTSPSFSVIFPDGKRFNSKEAVQSTQGDYIWSDRVTFVYMNDRNYRLGEHYARFSCHSKDKEFVGDCEIDILNLVSGPLKYDLPLDHGFNGCRITFIATSIEYLQSQVKIEQFTYGLVNDDNTNYNFIIKGKLLSKQEEIAQCNINYNSDTLSYVQSNDFILDAILCYKDLQTDMEIEIYNSDDDTQYDIVRFGIHKLYIHDQLEYTFNTPLGHKVSLYLSIINKPYYVQALNGTYYGNGRYVGYIPTPGAYVLNTKNEDLIKYNEPIAQPPDGAVKTFKAFTAKITFTKLIIKGSNLPDGVYLRARNTVNSKREKIVLVKEGDYYQCENYHFIPLEIKRPYQLNRRFLILDLVTEAGDFIGDIYLNLHNLFCGPPKYIVDFHCPDETVTATAEFDLEVINGRTMKVKFAGFSLESTDQTRECYIKFGFDGNELRFDISREENGYLYYDGEYEVNIFYSTASKNIQAYIINVMVVQKRFLKDLTLFTAKYSLMKILPFKPFKKLHIPFEQANMSNFICDISMSTSLIRNGLYGEYKLLESGIFNNGTMDGSTYREVQTFTEFCQPPYFPTSYAESGDVSQVSEEPLDRVECSVLSGIDNQDKVLILLTDDKVEIRSLDGETLLFEYPINSNLQSNCNTNQLTLISPKDHIQLYTKRAKDIKVFIDQHTVQVDEEEIKDQTNQGYYCLCSPDCRGAISVTCPICSFHPMDFSLFNYAIAHCNTCEFETYTHYKDDEPVEIPCSVCGEQLVVLEDTIQRTFICSCGFPLGSTCKRCDNVPVFDNPKVYMRKACSECGQVQLINEKISNDVQCAKCKTVIKVQ